MNSQSLFASLLLHLSEAVRKNTSVKAATLLCLLFSFYMVYSQAINPQTPEWLKRLDYIYYDLRFNEMPLQRSDSVHRVVILDIDDESIMAEGRWPWPRNKLAELTRAAFDAGAVVVSYDIVFSEAQENIIDAFAGAIDNPQLQRELDAYRDNFDGDQALNEAMSQGDAVLGYFTQGIEKFKLNSLPEPLVSLSDQDLQNFIAIEEKGWTTNLAMFQDVASREGYVTSFPDSDGVVRRSPLMIKIGENLYPSMAFAAVLSYLIVDEAPEVKLQKYGELSAIRAIKIADNWINTDIMMNVLVPYRGPKKSYPYVSVTHLLNGDPEAINLLDGAIVLVGTSAAGLYDLRATPLDEVYPGVEVHANLIDGMLQGAIPFRPDWERGASLVILSIFGVLFSFAFPRLSPFWLLSIGGIALASALIANNYLWVYKMMELPVASQILLVLGTMVISMAQGFLTEAATRQRIKAIFDQYVPPQHVSTMLKDPESINLEGESRDMTIFFMDIRGFTSISEALDAVKLKRFLSRIFTPVTQSIFDHNGTIDKYVGDMVMAFWGAPLPDDQHRYRAVKTALAVSDIMHDVRKNLALEGLPEPYVGIGINSGVVNVGDMGSEIRRTYTVIGDAVNLASRVESLTKFYGVELLVGEDTQKPLGDVFLWREIDRIQVKGKEQVVSIFVPLAESGQASALLQDQEALYREAKAHYLQRDWQIAQKMFLALQKDDPQKIFDIYLERIAEFVEQPPAEDWQGEYRHLSK